MQAPQPPRTARFGKYPITFGLGGLPPGSPAWGEGFARGLAQQYTRSMFFGTHGTSLPVPTNSISLDPSLKDAWGLPAMRVTYTDHPDDLKNLFICDGRSLVTSTRGQPTMTIMALAFRAGENIAGFAKRGEI